jgi:ABC-2 type transport system permease protein
VMIIPFVVVFVSGLIIAYSLGMIISTISMWFINAYPLPMLAQELIFMSQNPYSIYAGIWKVVFLTLVPVAFMVSIPTSILLGHFSFWWVPASVTVAGVFLYASHRFWNFALKKYSSASS